MGWGGDGVGRGQTTHHFLTHARADAPPLNFTCVQQTGINTWARCRARLWRARAWWRARPRPPTGGWGRGRSLGQSHAASRPRRLTPTARICRQQAGRRRGEGRTRGEMPAWTLRCAACPPAPACARHCVPSQAKEVRASRTQQAHTRARAHDGQGVDGAAPRKREAGAGRGRVSWCVSLAALVREAGRSEKRNMSTEGEGVGGGGSFEGATLTHTLRGARCYFHKVAG